MPDDEVRQVPTNLQETAHSEIPRAEAASNMLQIMEQNKWKNEATLYELGSLLKSFAPEDEEDFLKKVASGGIDPRKVQTLRKEAEEVYKRHKFNYPINEFDAIAKVKPIDGNDTVFWEYNEELSVAIIQRIESGEFTPLNERLSTFDKGVKDVLAKYVKSLGVQTEVEFPEIIVQSKSSDTGNIEPGLIELSRMESIKDPDIRMYLQAKALFHERYHALATANLVEPKQGAGYKDERYGLRYTRNLKDKKSSSKPLLEEGLAESMTIAAEEIIAEAFPEGKRKFEALLDLIQENYPTSDRRFLRIGAVTEGLDYDNLQKQDLKEIKFGYEPYKDQVLVTEYIEAAMGADFRELVERARIDGETLKLAREIEKVFGPLSYMEIIMCDPYDAITLKETLEKRRALLMAGQMIKDYTRRFKERFTTQEEWKSFYEEELEQARMEKRYREAFQRARDEGTEKENRYDNYNTSSNQQNNPEPNLANMNEQIINVVQQVALEKLDPEVKIQMEKLEAEGLSREKVYTRLARTFHPDKVPLDEQHTDERNMMTSRFQDLVDLQDTGYFGHQIKNIPGLK